MTDTCTMRVSRDLQSVVVYFLLHLNLHYNSYSDVFTGTSSNTQLGKTEDKKSVNVTIIIPQLFTSSGTPAGGSTSVFLCLQISKLSVQNTADLFLLNGSNMKHPKVCLSR